MTDHLQRAIARVVANGNCIGCGACELLSSRVTVRLDETGFARPSVELAPDNGGREEAKLFRRVCPGVGRRAPSRHQGAQYDETFGQFLTASQGSATNPDIRRSGSSGGVLTALASMLAESSGDGIVAVQSAADPTRSTAVVSPAQGVRDAAGSRYAPVSSAGLAGRSAVHVGKPCEVAAIDRMVAEGVVSDRPVLLSFLCAGTPTQHATDDLLRHLGADPDAVVGLRYRGNGWPGEFEAVTGTGERFSCSYDDAWGKVLGRRVQWGCKLCPDGTGEHADISVGDYWDADENGYPIFKEADGNSVVIARTRRGQEILDEAVTRGIIRLEAVAIGDVAKVQPLQFERRITLVGRLAGRAASGRRIPRYRGYGIYRRLVRHPRWNFRALVGTIVRTRRDPSASA